MSAADPGADWSEDGGGGGSRNPFKRWGRLAGIGAALGMSAIFAVAAWYALQRSDLRPSVMAEVPLVKAEPGPVKEKPEDPGGLKIPNQDKLVFERITPKPEAPVAEKLAPPPEEPIVKLTAPAAPAIAETAKSETKEAAASETTPIAAKPASEQTAAAKTALATAPKQAAPPTAPATVEAPAAPSMKSMAAKVESLLPAAGTAKRQSSGDAALPTPKKEGMAPPKMTEKAAAETPTAPEIKAPVAKTEAAKPAKSGYRIQMAAYRNAAQADVAWGRLQKKHGDVLGGLSGHTAQADLGKRGTYYRVQAGFFGNAAAARAACAKLKAKRQDCIIVPP